MRRIFGRDRLGQPEFGSPTRGPARAVALVVSAAMLVLSSSTTPSADTKEWPRLFINNLMTYHSVRIALSGATLWLEKSHCRGVFAEFRDDTDSPLSNRLTTLGVDEAAYLRLLVFRDGSRTRQCDNPTTIMYTTRNNRVVFVCESQVEMTRRTDPARLRAVVIHEALHTLGLGENPPTSAYITKRVIDRCWR